jgi:hypothetical protein
MSFLRDGFTTPMTFFSVLIRKITFRDAGKLALWRPQFEHLLILIIFLTSHWQV